MQLSNPQRKQCLEVSGGHLSYDANYAMPGLAMQIYSRQANHCLEGGGEVHYVTSCASGRITRMMIADICGSEDAFRRLSCKMRDGLVRRINSVWQNKVVDDVGKQFREFAHQGGCGTASVATYFAPTKTFVMCNIGNPPPLLFRARHRRWEVIHGETQAELPESESIEGIYGENEYRHIQIKLETDDTIVIYGNGFAGSAFPTGGYVGHSRLMQALQDSPHTHPTSRLAHLIGMIQTEDTGEEDRTVIVCKVTNDAVRWRDNLLAPFRLFRKPTDSTLIK